LQRRIQNIANGLDIVFQMKPAHAQRFAVCIETMVTGISHETSEGEVRAYILQEQGVAYAVGKLAVVHPARARCDPGRFEALNVLLQISH